MLTRWKWLNEHMPSRYVDHYHRELEKHTSAWSLYKADTAELERAIKGEVSPPPTPTTASAYPTQYADQLIKEIVGFINPKQNPKKMADQPMQAVIAALQTVADTVDAPAEVWGKLEPVLIALKEERKQDSKAWLQLIKTSLEGTTTTALPTWLSALIQAFDTVNQEKQTTLLNKLLWSIEQADGKQTPDIWLAALLKDLKAEDKQEETQWMEMLIDSLHATEQELLKTNNLTEQVEKEIGQADAKAKKKYIEDVEKQISTAGIYQLLDSFIPPIDPSAVPTSASKSKEEEYVDSLKEQLQTILANKIKAIEKEQADNKDVEKKLANAWFPYFITCTRQFHIARLSVSRMYGYYKLAAPENKDGSSYDSPEMIESIFICSSLLYIPLLFEIGRTSKNELDNRRKWFQVADAFVWSIINLSRLDGSGTKEFNAATDIYHSDLMSGAMVSSYFLLAGYLFDLFNQLYFDYHRYLAEKEKLQHISNKIKLLEAQLEVARKSTIAATPAGIAEIQRLELEIFAQLYNRDAQIAELKRFRTLVISWNVFYALGLSSGALYNALTVGSAAAVSNPVGALIIVCITTANQLKNLVDSYYRYKMTQKICAKRLAQLNVLERDLEKINPANHHAINIALAKQGLPPMRLDLIFLKDKTLFPKKNEKTTAAELESAEEIEKKKNKIYIKLDADGLRLEYATASMVGSGQRAFIPAADLNQEPGFRIPENFQEYSVLKAKILSIILVTQQPPFSLRGYIAHQKNALVSQESAALKTLNMNCMWYLGLVGITSLLFAGTLGAATVLSGPFGGLGLFVVGVLLYGLYKAYSEPKKSESTQSMQPLFSSNPSGPEGNFGRQQSVHYLNK